MENLYLLHDTYYKGDFYLSITINGMGDLKLCIYMYKYIEVKTFFYFSSSCQQFMSKFNRNYGDFREEMIRDHVVMSCVSSRWRQCLLREKDLSLSLSLSFSHAALEHRSKNKIHSVDEKKPGGIYYTDLSAYESGREFANNITPKTEEKNFPKLVAK